MGYRYDMQGKTLQQQIIVSKRDEEDRRRKKESAKNVPITVNAVTRVAAMDEDTNSFSIKCFEDFLRTKKKLTDAGINSRLSRLRWVEDLCEQSAASLSLDIQTMHKSREHIYEKAKTEHMAGNYYNALMLYYEYIHGSKCPPINKKSIQ